FTPGSFDRMVHGFPDWFCKRLPWFIGREDKLPVDQNSLMALIAPRGLMMASAITEYEGNPWGVEQSYQSVKQVYHFLQADSALAILLRHGRHQHARRDIERYLDFFDYIFKRSSIPPPQNKLYYDYSFEKWKQWSGEHLDPLKFPRAGNSPSNYFTNRTSFSEQQDNIRKQLYWLLGDKPPEVPVNKTYSSLINGNKDYKDDYLSEVIGEFNLPQDIKIMKFGPYSALGDDLWCTLYFPPGTVKHNSASDKLPLVIYLHNYDYSIGYRNSQRNASLIQKFTQNGFAVLMFDLVGFGTRIPEAKYFYNRYPHWSKMGSMVTDVLNIIADASLRMPFIDPQNIYLVGYSLGGTVALLTAALDKRVKGTAVIGAFSSFRHDNGETEGIRHYCCLHGLIPRLGFFLDHEDRIPLDFDDILACIVPRPLLVIAPKRDRNHTIKNVQEIVSAGSVAYSNMNSADRLTFEQPDTYNHFTDTMQHQIATWLIKQKKRG
ncbi:MAG: alpha/beta hydrolase family protein, partial [Rhabdochlamydiaceae bacterium]